MTSLSEDRVKSTGTTAAAPSSPPPAPPLNGTPITFDHTGTRGDTQRTELQRTTPRTGPGNGSDSDRAALSGVVVCADADSEGVQRIARGQCQQSTDTGPAAFLFAVTCAAAADAGAAAADSLARFGSV
jgi:hypothetical protein